MDLQALNTVLDQASAILASYEQATSLVSTTEPTAAPTRASRTECLAEAKRCASLIKAHSTKLSLLIINEPFTPKAIADVVSSLMLEGAISNLAAAVQDSARNLHTQAFSRELAFRAVSVMEELRKLIMIIPRDGSVVSKDQRTSSTVGSGLGSVTATGLLWRRCTEVIDLAEEGVTGYLVREVNGLEATLQDIIEELKDWRDQCPDDYDEEENDDGEQGAREEDDGDKDGESVSGDDDQDTIDKLMEFPKPIPQSDPDKIRPRLDVCLRNIRLTTSLYKAIVKRRLKTLTRPEELSASTTEAVDAALGHMRRIRDEANDLATDLYESKPSVIDDRMSLIVELAVETAQMFAKPWDQAAEGDQFTDWVQKFERELRNKTDEDG